MPSDASNAEWVRFERDRAREKRMYSFTSLARSFTNSFKVMPIKVDMAVVRNALESLDPANRKEPRNDKSHNVKKKK